MWSEAVVPLIMIVLGLVLLFIEVAIFPGFGVPGIAGLVLVAAGVFVVWSELGSAWGVACVVVAVPLFVAALWAFFRSKASKRLVQEGKIIGHSSQVATLTNLVGRSGVAVTLLRPSGLAEIDGVRYDVMSAGERIDKGMKVVVREIRTNSIIVEQTE